MDIHNLCSLTAMIINNHISIQAVAFFQTFPAAEINCLRFCGLAKLSENRIIVIQDTAVLLRLVSRNPLFYFYVTIHSFMTI